MASEPITIERGIPAPAPSGGGKKATYPWTAMEVGDSFFVPDPPRNFPGMVHNAARTFGRRFAQRKVDGGIRVWRLA